MKEKKKMLITLILLLSIICVTIGVTFAAFSFVKQGTVENTLETGTVMLTYTEGKTGIILEDALPMSDETGKLLTGENNVFDFTVTATLGKATTIGYEVTAVKIPITDMEPLLDTEVKLYLERAIDPDVTYTSILEPTNFIPMEESTEIGSPAGSMILDKGMFLEEGVTIHHYRLRMWVDENTEITEVQKKYGVKINVYAKQDVVMYTDESCFTFDETTKTITDYSNEKSCSRDVIIPEKIKGVTVEIIGYSAFEPENCSDEYIDECENQITSVVLPDNVIEIQDTAFALNHLSEVNIPNSVTRIGHKAFYYNDLKKLTLGNSVTTIETQAFSSNDLTTLTIPDSVVLIGNNSFSWNDLTSVIIGKNVKTIELRAFWENQLTSVIFLGGTEKLEQEAFSSNQLTNLILPEGMIEIGDYAFWDNQLTSVIIPNSVTTIKIGAFKKASDSNPNLEKIVNKTGRSFSWGRITGGSSANFITGTVSCSGGDIIVTDME